MLKQLLEEELAARAERGQRPVSQGAIKTRLAALGYRLDRSMDCRSLARWMTGERAGKSYPVITTGVKEADTGLSFANVNARRDAAFQALQSIRSSGECFAVVRGCILEF